MVARWTELLGTEKATNRPQNDHRDQKEPRELLGSLSPCPSHSGWPRDARMGRGVWICSPRTRRGWGPQVERRGQPLLVTTAGGDDGPVSQSRPHPAVFLPPQHGL